MEALERAVAALHSLAAGSSGGGGDGKLAAATATPAWEQRRADNGAAVRGRGAAAAASGDPPHLLQQQQQPTAPRLGGYQRQLAQQLAHAPGNCLTFLPLGGRGSGRGTQMLHVQHQPWALAACFAPQNSSRAPAALPPTHSPAQPCSPLSARP